MPVALILGGAPTVWEDLERAQALTAGRDTIIVATNNAGWLYQGRIDAWATLHPERFEAWRQKRVGRGLNEDYRAFAHRRRGARGFEIYPHRLTGSSGLYAAEIALKVLGVSGVIVCGVPITVEAGHVVEPGGWTRAETYRPAWLAAKEAGLPIRSMSGWTAELMGEPDAGWLESLALGPARTRAPEAKMWIEMLRDRNFTPPGDRRITVKYREGRSYPVKRAWGEAMVADGDAKEARAPKKPAEERGAEAYVPPKEADGPRG